MLSKSRSKDNFEWKVKSSKVEENPGQAQLSQIFILKLREIEEYPIFPDFSLEIRGNQNCPQFSSIFGLKILNYLTT